MSVGRRIDEHELRVQVLHLLVVGRLRDEELGLGGLRLLRDLGGSEERIRGGGHGAAVGGAEEGEDEFGGIGEEDHDYVTLPDSELVEAGGDASGGELDVVVGVDMAGGGTDEAGAGSEFGEVLEAVGMEREVFGDVYVRELGPENEVVLLLGFCSHWRNEGELGLVWRRKRKMKMKSGCWRFGWVGSRNLGVLAEGETVRDAL